MSYSDYSEALKSYASDDWSSALRPRRARVVGPLPDEDYNAEKATQDVHYNMIHRCNFSSNPSYKHYGGRGIVVCDRWLTSYENFVEDMGLKPNGLSLDRIDVDGNYEPKNCRWATDEQQANNRRSNRWYKERNSVSSRDTI